MESIPE